jgi:hypothetical protein
LGELGYFQYIEFCLDLGNFIIKLALPLGNGVILCPEPCLVNRAALVEIIELVYLGSQSLLFRE